METSEIVSYIITDLVLLLVWVIIYMVSRSKGANVLGAIMFPFVCFVSISIILLFLEFNYYSYTISRMVFAPIHLMMQHGRFISLYVLLPLFCTGLIFWWNRRKWRSNLVNVIAIVPILFGSIGIFMEQYSGIEYYETAYTQVIGVEKPDDVKIEFRTKDDCDDEIHEIIRMRLTMGDEMYMVVNKQIADLYLLSDVDVTSISVPELDIIPHQVAKKYNGWRNGKYVNVYFLNDLETVCIEIQRPLRE